MFWKKKPSPGSKRLEPAEAPVRQALVLVCEKCGKKMQDGDENPSKNLQSALKSHFKSNVGKREVRPLLSSCFDLCPNKKIAVALVPLGGPTRFYEIEKGDQQSVIDEITSRLSLDSKK